jgi:hypothetical protein
MSQLKKAVGELRVLTICSDAKKGLMHAVTHCFPHAEKRVLPTSHGQLCQKLLRF